MWQAAACMHACVAVDGGGGAAALSVGGGGSSALVHKQQLILHVAAGSPWCTFPLQQLITLVHLTVLFGAGAQPVRGRARPGRGGGAGEHHLAEQLWPSGGG